MTPMCTGDDYLPCSGDPHLEAAADDSRWNDAQQLDNMVNQQPLFRLSSTGAEPS